MDTKLVGVWAGNNNEYLSFIYKHPEYGNSVFIRDKKDLLGRHFDLIIRTGNYSVSPSSGAMWHEIKDSLNNGPIQGEILEYHDWDSTFHIVYKANPVYNKYHLDHYTPAHKFHQFVDMSKTEEKILKSYAMLDYTKMDTSYKVPVNIKLPSTWGDMKVKKVKATKIPELCELEGKKYTLDESRGILNEVKAF